MACRQWAAVCHIPVKHSRLTAASALLLFATRPQATDLIIFTSRVLGIRGQYVGHSSRTRGSVRGCGGLQRLKGTPDDSQRCGCTPRFFRKIGRGRGATVRRLAVAAPVDEKQAEKRLPHWRHMPLSEALDSLEEALTRFVGETFLGLPVGILEKHREGFVAVSSCGL